MPALKTLHHRLGKRLTLARLAPPPLSVAEPALRRSVPLLTVFFLGILAFARIVTLMEHRDEIGQAAVENLALAASLLRAEDVARSDLQADPSAHAQALLTSTLPASLRSDGALAFITDIDGDIIATTPGAERLIGENGGAILYGGQPLFVFGERAGVMQTRLEGRDALTSAAILAEPLGAVAIVQDQKRLFAEWRRTVSVNVTLFALTSIVLLTILLAYFRQATLTSIADTVATDAHRRVETALSRGRCGLWDWDLARGRMYWSRSMYEILGMPAKEGILSFGEVAKLMHPDDGSFFEIARQIASGKLSNIERTFRMRRSDGHFIWLRARAEVVRNAGNDIHLIGVAVDVSENHALARLTSEATARLQNAVENISETFVLWDSEDRLVLCNSKYQEVFGLSHEHIRPGTAMDIVRLNARKPIEERKLTSPSFVQGERASEALLADGRWLQISERLTSDGGHVSIGTDVTQLKVHQERLSDSERRLMATINDLSASRRDAEAKAHQLTDLNASFLQEKDRAESANRAKTTFLANMSHELRTPLNAIIGFSEIMREESFGPIGSQKYCEYAADIHQSGHWLLKLINDILDMSKIEAGRMALTMETIDMGEIVAEATRIVDVQAEAKQLNVTAEHSGDLVLSADRRATKQILLNLLANAVKFTDTGGSVRVRTRQLRGHAVVTIADNGIGIPPESLGNLGRPFEQVENELTRTNKGTGLGLAIARSLIELQGGRMRIASRVGEGTIVSFRLPLESRAQASNADAA
ncbi:sensor histidine kinase [Aureimonas mangrovi]|uniref:sensor histidine kinase n=1 Tax=Aureimonas mangrovi TaxID=2758041 RepID=UPI001FEA9D12|nr:ATP-binding protein [Aureimonas mangrovi]